MHTQATALAAEVDQHRQDRINHLLPPPSQPFVDTSFEPRPFFIVNPQMVVDALPEVGYPINRIIISMTESYRRWSP
jgi:hypothetical protein